MFFHLSGFELISKNVVISSVSLRLCGITAVVRFKILKYRPPHVPTLITTADLYSPADLSIVIFNGQGHQLYVRMPCFSKLLHQIQANSRCSARIPRYPPPYICCTGATQQPVCNYYPSCRPASHHISRSSTASLISSDNPLRTY